MLQLPPSSAFESGGDKLFVGNLPFDATEEELSNLFGKFGTVLEVFLLGAGRSKSGQGCAFVRFADASSASLAIARLNGQASLRQPGPVPTLLEVRLAKSTQCHKQKQFDSAELNERKRNGISYQPELPSGSVRLFVGNLPLDVTPRELNEVFKSLGILVLESETFLMTGKVHQNNAICAFVVVASGDDASNAIKRIDNTLRLRPSGLILKVKVANDASNTKAKRSRSGSMVSCTNEFPIESNFFVTPSVRSPEYCYDYVNSKEPSIRTYHPYMMLPQSVHYGSLNIIPGDEPWRNNGIYSLPFTTNSFFVGQ